eukprot:437059-Rhodomonas_salina.4
MGYCERVERQRRVNGGDRTRDGATGHVTSADIQSTSSSLSLPIRDLSTAHRLPLTAQPLAPYASSLPHTALVVTPCQYRELYSKCIEAIAVPDIA